MVDAVLFSCPMGVGPYPRPEQNPTDDKYLTRIPTILRVFRLQVELLKNLNSFNFFFMELPFKCERIFLPFFGYPGKPLRTET